MNAWDQAHALNKRAFYERATDTIRSCPENVCLAHRAKVGSPWQLFGDMYFAGWHRALTRTIEVYGKYSTADALAEELGKVLDSNKAR